MTWASLEEYQGNTFRAAEIRNLYFQQRTEVTDDASWVAEFLDIIDPIGRIRRLFNLDENSFYKENDSPRDASVVNDNGDEQTSPSDDVESETGFDLDGFICVKLSLDPSQLDVLLETSTKEIKPKTKPWRRAWRSEDKTATQQCQS